MYITHVEANSLEELCRNICIQMGLPDGAQVTVDTARVKVSAYFAGKLFNKETADKIQISHILSNDKNLRQAVLVRPGFIVRLSVGVYRHETNGLVDEEKVMMAGAASRFAANNLPDSDLESYNEENPDDRHFFSMQNLELTNNIYAAENLLSFTI